MSNKIKVGSFVIDDCNEIGFVMAVYTNSFREKMITVNSNGNRQMNKCKLLNFDDFIHTVKTLANNTYFKEIEKLCLQKDYYDNADNLLKEITKIKDIIKNCKRNVKI